MPDNQHDPPPQTPTFVTDEATTADAEEKLSVAPDVTSEDEPDAMGDPQDRAPDDFEVDDAITKTATDGPAGEE